MSSRQPTNEEMADLEFAWKVAKFVKSNAIVLAKDKVTLGIGAGQMSRVDSTEIAINKSQGKTQGAVMASDGFFPFRDSLDLTAKNGITAVVEPGGSINDKEVIEAATQHNIALLFKQRQKILPRKHEINKINYKINTRLTLEKIW
jgi:phosphoribosylaminoimidazolecarboxamide formyltransferase/IMP cyclohydrolase